MNKFPKRNPRSLFSKNEMLWNLGLPPEHMEDVNLVQEHIASVETKFDLVMIAEKVVQVMFVQCTQANIFPCQNFPSLERNVLQI